MSIKNKTTVQKGKKKDERKSGGVRSIPNLALSRWEFHNSQNPMRLLLKNSHQHLPKLAKKRSANLVKHLYFKHLQHLLKPDLKTIIRYIVKE